MGDRPYDETKFAEMMMYVASRLRESPAGATKLNKLLWYADIEHFRRHGRTITGAEYQKLEWGPAPRRLLPVREQLINSGQAEQVKTQSGDWVEQRLVPRRAPDISVFTPEELTVIDDVVERMRPLTASQISDLSHREPAWFLPAMQDTIEPELAYLRPARLTPKVRERARQLAAERGLLPS
jgi:hypothetical protein